MYARDRRHRPLERGQAFHLRDTRRARGAAGPSRGGPLRRGQQAARGFRARRFGFVRRGRRQAQARFAHARTLRRAHARADPPRVLDQGVVSLPARGCAPAHDPRAASRRQGQGEAREHGLPCARRGRGGRARSFEEEGRFLPRARAERNIGAARLGEVAHERRGHRGVRAGRFRHHQRAHKKRVSCAGGLRDVPRPLRPRPGRARRTARAHKRAAKGARGHLRTDGGARGHGAFARRDRQRQDGGLHAILRPRHQRGRPGHRARAGNLPHAAGDGALPQPLRGARGRAALAAFPGRAVRRMAKDTFGQGGRRHRRAERRVRAAREHPPDRRGRGARALVPLRAHAALRRGRGRASARP